MAEAETPKRPSWFWPVVAVVVLVLVAGGVSAPSVIECTNARDGFQTCLSNKLADLGIGSRIEVPPADEASDDSGVAVAEPADTAVVPEAAATVSAPDFGVRVEPNGSMVIVGSGIKGKTVQIFVNGKLYGTADVDPSGDWVLVPDAPLPPGGYELTVVDPETGKPIDKSFVVAINEDKTSEPLVVASTPGAASEILQGLTPPTAVAEAEVPAATEEPAPAEEPVAETPEEPVAVATADGAQEAVEAINEAAAAPADAAAIASTPPEVAVEAETPDEAASAAPAEEPAAETEVATAEAAAPEQDVVAAADALQARIDALGANVPPTIDAVEIDNGKNFFAGTGANGTVIRVYVDNVFVGDAPVENGHWLLETSDVLKNRSQRVRADQLLPDSAEVAARAEIDFIFEAPAAAPDETVVAEAPITVPEPDFGIDTDIPADVPVEVAEAAPVEEPAAVEPPAEEPAVTEPPAEEPVAPASEPAAAETEVAAADVPAAAEPAAADVSATAESSAVEPAVEPAGSGATTEVASAEPAAPASNAESAAAPGSGTASSGAGTGGDAGAAISVPEPDFSIDTGIPVTVVAEAPADSVTMAGEGTGEAAEPAAEVAEAPVAEPETAPEPETMTEPEPQSEPVVVADAAPADVQPEVPQLVAVPVGEPELGRFATGKAIIRSGDNLWTIARRVYGSGLKYTQIYGANRDQIRNPNLIYPGQVFDLPKTGDVATSE